MTSNNLVRDAAAQVREMILAALKAAMEAGELPQAEIPAFAVEIPADTSHGDFASNIAMAGARAFRCAPPKIAAAVLNHLDFNGTWFVRAESAGPGFLNFFLRPQWFAAVLESIQALGESYGRTNAGNGKKVMVEFVSANPTGPMHMGNARGGAIGDALAAALDAAGYDVTREFYINDAGNQIEKFAISLNVRYLQHFEGEEAHPLPEDCYQGEDIKDRVKEFATIHGDKYLHTSEEERKKALVDYALPKNIQAMKDDLSRYRITYDNWFHESSLYERGLVDKVVGILTEKGLTYEKDGALWYRASEFGAEKDEVLIRGNGNATYFAADIAYHYDKFALRSFETVIDVWGADHHGHVARLKGAMDAIGLSGDKLDIVLMQLVRLMKDGEPYRMSKRSGRSVTLRDLLDDVEVDAARFFFNMQSPGSS
ncbi:MAG TPA: arginine--tRNA ligase, partial [Clostridiales bacterium]|nr:arginine--tRNA ligase [Clostridiales bacterium]